MTSKGWRITFDGKCRPELFPTKFEAMLFVEMLTMSKHFRDCKEKWLSDLEKV